MLTREKISTITLDQQLPDRVSPRKLQSYPNGPENSCNLAASLALSPI